MFGILLSVDGDRDSSYAFPYNAWPVPSVVLGVPCTNGLTLNVLVYDAVKVITHSVETG